MPDSDPAGVTGGPQGPPASLGPTRDVADWAAAFDPALLSRAVAMIGNYRCGTTLFKTTATQFGDIDAGFEPFSRISDGAGPHALDLFLAAVPGATEAAMLQPEQALRAYLAWYLDRVPEHRLLLDLKYTDLGRLGLTPESSPVPLILAQLASWRLPVIHVQRMASLREAISFLVALRTRRFQHFANQPAAGPAPGDEAIHLDPDTVIETARRCRAAHATAAGWLERLEMTHHRVFYEEFRGRDRAAVILRALHAVGIWCEPPDALSEAVLEQRSADQVSNLAEILDRARRTAPELFTG